MSTCIDQLLRHREKGRAKPSEMVFYTRHSGIAVIVMRTSFIEFYPLSELRRCPH